MKRFVVQFLKIQLLILITCASLSAVLYWSLWPVPSDMVGLRMSVYWCVFTWLGLLAIWAVVFAVIETVIEYRGRKYVKNLSA